MRVNNYLSVCMFQLNMQLDCNSKYEYLIETTEVFKQIEKAFTIIEKYQPDIALFPEMAYVSRYEEMYQKLSTQIKQHEFWIKGRKIYILNCMEYYHTAYYIARDEKLKDKLFGIFTICSNSNTRVFEEETVAIHNHNENLYTFTLNCVSIYQKKSYGDGKSYIYGPVSQHEKDWLREEGIESKKNVCHVLSLSGEKAQFIYGKFVAPENLSKFGRSDNYLNNPRDIILSDL